MCALIVNYYCRFILPQPVGPFVPNLLPSNASLLLSQGRAGCPGRQEGHFQAGPRAPCSPLSPTIPSAAPQPTLMTTVTPRGPLATRTPSTFFSTILFAFNSGIKRAPLSAVYR